MSGLSLAAASAYGQLDLNFSATTGGALQFNGSSNSFQFNNGPSGYQWDVTSGGSGSAIGLLGSISAPGPFTYGSISSTGSGITLIQDALVTGPLGHFVINDGLGNLLTGTVSWGDVATFATSGGGMDTQANIDLTGMSYGGTNPDLQQLANDVSATLTVSFQFAGTGQTLTSLSTGAGPYVTSFSGSIIGVPEPSSLALLAFGGLSMLHFYRRK